MTRPCGTKTVLVGVTNTSQAPLAITGITRNGGATTQFPQVTFPTLANGGCRPPRTLAAGASCTVTARFNPTSVGLKSSTLRVTVAAPAAQPDGAA